MTEHVYQPHGTCVDLFRSRDAEVLFAGPAGTGKSRACLEKVHLMCMLNPGMRALVVRKTAVSLGSTALVTFEEHVAKEHLESGELSWYGGSPKEAACYKYKNGSVIVVGGMDKPMKIMSSEYDLCYVQEATELTEIDWESITTRLRNGKVSFQQLMADANPDTPTHWLKQRCDQGKTKMIASRHEDNPVLFQEGVLTAAGRNYMSKLDSLTGVRFLRLRKGIWAAAEGLVYDGWDPAVHLYKRMGCPPRAWTRYWSIDFGYTNPFVCQMWAEDPDGRLFLYRELYETGQTVDVMAQKIKKAMRSERQGQDDPAPALIVCDHDAEGRAVLERELGMKTVAAKKTVTDGIQAVQRRLRPAGDGLPRLFICRDALVKADPLLEMSKKPLSTEQEIAGYVWDRGTAKAQADGKAPKEAPLKEDDHGMDAMRYMVAAKDLAGRFNIRVMDY